MIQSGFLWDHRVACVVNALLYCIIIHAGTAFLTQLQAGLFIQAISDFHCEVSFYFPSICLKPCNLGGITHSFFPAGFAEGFVWYHKSVVILEIKPRQITPHFPLLCTIRRIMSYRVANPEMQQSEFGAVLPAAQI